MSEMTPAKATSLRKPFPPESVGKLPKGGVMLDYVGHAAVTDRLLSVDPNWSWEPMALDQFGSPFCDKEGNLWIKLTVCGVTRLGVGDGKNMKERVGDAIRNAAMRFGVALDLWAKENLVEFAQASVATVAELQRGGVAHPTYPEPDPPPPANNEPPAAADPKPLTAKTRGQMFALFGQKGIDEAAQLPGINHILGTDYQSRSELTEADAKEVIRVLKTKPDAQQAEAS
jgi:hypothetical protein